MPDSIVSAHIVASVGEGVSYTIRLNLGGIVCRGDHDLVDRGVLTRGSCRLSSTSDLDAPPRQEIILRKLNPKYL